MLIAGLVTGTVWLLLATLRRNADLDDARAQLTMLLAEQSAMQGVLWETTSLQQAVLENANCCIVATDEQGTIRSFNATAERWLGYDAGELVGQSTPAVLHTPTELAQRAAELSSTTGETIEPGFDVLTLAARQGRTEERDWTLVRKDGSTLPVKLSVAPIHNEAGRLTGFVGVAVDMTGERRTQAELAVARDHAIAATRAKSAFLATMTHEIRTPLAGVIGLSGLLLEDDGLSASSRDTARTILGSAENLLTIVNDLLDYSKIEAGALQLEHVDVDIRTLVADVFHLLGQEARRRGLALESVVSATVPERLTGDPLRLRQILLNLVGNALKFTAAGSVTVQATCARREGDRMLLRVEVTDTGCGIPPETQQQLFQSYAQADTSTARHFGGTGLGLAICRQLTGLMQGTIGVISAVGRGSTFWFEVPLGEARAARSRPVPDAAPRAQTGRLAILLAEDNEINQRIAVSMLRKLGHTATVVGDGRSAVAAVAGRRFDVVLMDCQMPEMDGFDATRAIRGSSDATVAATPIVALTAHAGEEDRERCLAAGMDDYLTKPLRIAELERTLDRVTAAGDVSVSGLPAA
jgi:signal transduction histidine kinase/ActR/RegA family two-component response regulator